MNTLYIFLDESGNLDFSRTGTAHYVLAAVTAIKPIESSTKMQQLKYSLLEAGTDTEYFHASEDKQVIRNKVFEILQTMSSSISIHYIYAKKAKAHPALQSSAAFYGKLGTTLVKFIVSYKSAGFNEVVIVFDKALTKKDEKAFLGDLKPELKRLGKPYRVYFHRTLSDFNGQIADYFAWAKYVSLERNEMRPLDSLVGIKMTHFDLFARGTKEWY